MKISLVVPVFNEQEAVPIFYRSVRTHTALSRQPVEIIFINDGSTDATETLIAGLAADDPLVKIISFTRNFGKEAALFAGLEAACGEVIIPIDVDLQDPLDVIPLLLEKWQRGADVVLAKRSDRSCDGRMKRKTAEWFYRLHNRISTPKIEENVGDFRLMSRETVDNIKQLPERNLFMKGVLSWVGGKIAIVEYTRDARIAGASKFNGWKLWNLALEGITSFSTFPLRIWSYIGFVIAGISFFYGAWMILDTLAFGNPVRGYPSLLISILFLGGVQLIGIGILGEYIGRIYTEAKKRPRYIKKNFKEEKS
ncbi:glycosyltransferase family 2 protein [Serratia sp. AKBS12]|uniref:glycosyltransferase family 2 protein n=1 Tax=Serratia sp. AKBS12 TaxID=2974597 RepID=UPI002166AF66|nr:glycosyltransferase family 2 protein [Serratia sp. AKBS12]MCS3408186.1 glycosyltransferase family 2 protein [Serratia sp. AKBS12]